MSRKALIVGATGLVGSHCLKTLLSSSDYTEVNVLVRRSLNLTLTDKEQKKLQEHLVDFDKLDTHAALFNVDDVFCCLGTTLKKAGSVAAFRKVDYDYCLETAKLAKAADVKHFLIVTAVNAKTESLAYYSRFKGELQDALINLEFERLSIFQPSLLLGERSDFRLLEGLWGKGSRIMNRLVPQKMSAFKAIDGRVVGRAMVAAAIQSEPKYKTKHCFHHYDGMQTLSESLIKFS